MTKQPEGKRKRNVVIKSMMVTHMKCGLQIQGLDAGAHMGEVLGEHSTNNFAKAEASWAAPLSRTTDVLQMSVDSGGGV
jgi:hypothetical protein